MGEEEAMQEIRALRDGSIETDDQEEAVRTCGMRKKQGLHFAIMMKSFLYVPFLLFT